MDPIAPLQGDRAARFDEPTPDQVRGDERRAAPDPALAGERPGHFGFREKTACNRLASQKKTGDCSSLVFLCEILRLHALRRSAQDDTSDYRLINPSVSLDMAS